MHLEKNLGDWNFWAVLYMTILYIHRSIYIYMLHCKPQTSFLKLPHMIQFAVQFACADLSLKLRRSTEKAHTPFSLSHHFLLILLLLSKICWMMYMDLSIVCNKKIERRHLIRWRWTENWLLKQNFLSHVNILRELRLDPGYY